MQKIKKIIVVGHDEVSLLVAATLAFNLRHVEIVLVNPAHKNPNSFIESSMGNINAFLGLAGIDVNHFISSTQATFKLGNAFHAWSSIGQEFYHCFGDYGVSASEVDFHQMMIRFNREGKSKAIGGLSLAAAAAVEGKFLPVVGGAKQEASKLVSGLHFNIPLFIQFLSRHLERLGVVRVPVDIIDVKIADDGCIAALRTNDNQQLSADFYIDCSGSYSQLLGKAMGVGYINWQDTLQANRKLCAVKPAAGQLSLLTDIVATKSGWIRCVRLRDFVVAEFFYLTNSCTDEQAHTELSKYMQGDQVKFFDATSFLSGRRERFWVKNCLAIGQSAVSIADFSHSPLFIAQAAIARFLDYFPSAEPDPELIDEYNRLTSDEVDRIYDYHSLHYWLLDKSHPLSIRSEDQLSKKLSNKLAVFLACGRVIEYEGDGIDPSQWSSLLLGMNAWPERYDPLIANFSSEQLELACKQMAVRIREIVSAMPTHEDVLANPMYNKK